MNLTAAEVAYLMRFEFETWFNLDGPGSVYAECQDRAANESPSTPASYLRDLADLATPSVQYQVIADVQFETDYTKLIHKYPRVPFPWESLAALHQRVLELDPLAQPRERGPAASAPV
jgi:hypothetical protein